MSAPAGPLPPASVIICSLERPGMLRETVESVLGGDEVPAEIVVIDQSAERHAWLAGTGPVRGCEIRYHQVVERGVSRARNRGMRVGRGEILAFLDDDVLVEPGWLGALLRAVQRMGEQGVATGRVLEAPSETPGGFAPALVAATEPAQYEGRILRDVLEAGNMAVHRRTLLRLRGFDERLGPGTRFPAGEDNDLGYRLLAAGCRIGYVPDATIYHRAWRGPGEYLPLRWRYGVGQGAYYAKHLSLRDRYMLGRLGRLVRHHLWLSVRRIRRPKAALGHAVYLAGVMRGAAAWGRATRTPSAPASEPSSGPGGRAG
ncbi:MAG TPA: glycosyltransferase [Gemmatimonadales bacterium]|nr:glycosyltransferase [Gemmatimonadales bacterium]